ncbi:hypothetical protein PG999_011112 [Apiospora kogelbergensis]|uniref:Uncharacterized protein n=1 Tax=Apiospora kogelbergensis TaxID=1337665 RepID=A0AAW0QSP5_9PEZI
MGETATTREVICDSGPSTSVSLPRHGQEITTHLDQSAALGPVSFHFSRRSKTCGLPFEPPSTAESSVQPWIPGSRRTQQLKSLTDMGRSQRSWDAWKLATGLLSLVLVPACHFSLDSPLRPTAPGERSIPGGGWQSNFSAPLPSHAESRIAYGF